MAGAALILAAGYSHRYGADKRTAVLENGRPMLEQTLERYQGAFSDVAVVLRTEDHALVRELESALGANMPRVIFTADAQRGMAHSLAAGVRALANWDYLFVGLGDMPYVSDQTLRALDKCISKHAARGHPAMVRPRHDAKPGHPVGFTHHFSRELSALTGDIGARPVLERHRKHLHYVEVDDIGVLQDIDTP